MIKIINFNLAIVFLMIIFSTNLFSETVKISTNAYEPYISIKNDENQGIMVEIVEEAFKAVGAKAEFKNYPFARATMLVEGKEESATMPKFKTEEREKKFIFSDPVIMSTAKFFYVKRRKIPDNFKWSSLSDFKMFRIGGTLGYWYLEEFKKVGINVDVTATNEQNIEKLYIGRIDVFLIDEITGWELIKKYDITKMKEFDTIDKPEKKEPLYLMFSRDDKKNLETMEKFNKGLKIIKANGIYDKILKKYSMKTK